LHCLYPLSAALPTSFPVSQFLSGFAGIDGQPEAITPLLLGDSLATCTLIPNGEDIKQTSEALGADVPCPCPLQQRTIDARSIYRKDWARESKMEWDIPGDDPVTLESYERDLSAIISRLLKTKAKSIAVHTIPMMGEDLESEANEIVRWPYPWENSKCVIPFVASF
jgi:hypothetical protein